MTSMASTQESGWENGAVRHGLMVGLCLLLLAGGVAFGRYVVPKATHAAPRPTTAVSTTTTSPTTTTTAPNGLPQGRYDIEGFEPGGNGLFLDVIDGTGDQVTVNVTTEGADGSQEPVAQMQGTAIDGTLTLTTNMCDSCDPPTVSASYGPTGNTPGQAPTGPVSIYFGATSNGCETWGGPISAAACNFVYAPTGG